MVQPFLRRSKAVLLLNAIDRKGVIQPHAFVGDREGRCEGKDEAENEQSGRHQIISSSVLQEFRQGGKTSGGAATNHHLAVAF
jgi:hypothetical protein